MTNAQLRWQRWYATAKFDPAWKERRRVYKHQSYLRCRAKHLATAKRWAKRNHAKVRAIWHQFYLRHLQEERRRSARYRRANLAKCRAAGESHRRRHLDKYAAKARRRLALKLGTFVGPVDYVAVVRAAKGRCGICGKRIGRALTHIDHIVPLAKGGSHTQDNLQLSHARCNLKKGARMP